jgi:hypothetical protein
MQLEVRKMEQHHQDLDSSNQTNHYLQLSAKYGICFYHFLQQKPPICHLCFDPLLAALKPSFQDQVTTSQTNHYLQLSAKYDEGYYLAKSRILLIFHLSFSLLQGLKISFHPK